MDVDDARSKITKRTKGIVPVHLFGAVSDMDAIMKLAKEHDLYVLEDCAEALGSTRGGRPAGSFGHAGSFSFFGNKTVTTGEGGMVVAREEKLATHMRLTKGQGQDPNRRYWHDRMGFNYRMTNIAAAIGCAQMERFEETLTRKAEIAGLYKNYLYDAPVQFQQLPDDVVSSNWLVSLLLPANIDRDVLMDMLKSDGVDSRPVFYCSHHLPMYADDAEKNNAFPIAEDIAARGISLPSYPSMTNDMVKWVCTALISAIKNQRRTIE